MKILTQRKYVNYISRAVIYEWEDIFSNVLDIQIEGLSNHRKKIYMKMILRLNIKRRMKYDSRREAYLFFALHVADLRYITWMKKNVIPIMLDVAEQNIDEVIYYTKHLPVFFVTALDTKYIIKTKYPDSNVEYIPLSVSDSIVQYPMISKSIDVVQFGRKNELLHSYMLRYCEEHKETEYIYSTKTKTGNFQYISTKSGVVGALDARSDFLDLMKKTKICIVSTPGIDGSRSFGENIDFFTPRWYECVANYCYILGRYSENEESRLLKINDICVNIKDYDSFSSQLKSYLATDHFLLEKEYHKFLEENVTSKRAKSVREMLLKYGIKSEGSR